MPWCQVNEVKAEQVTSTVARETELEQLFDWKQYSTFNRIQKFIAKGRLKHSNLDYNAKHPILLTAKHPVVQLLLEKAHRDNLHEGTEYVRNKLQQE